MAPAEEGDSGMESLTTSSKDLTPEKVKDIGDTDDDSEDEDLDETLAERLWGLTEMFPDRVRETTYNVTSASWSAVKGLYKFGCNASWIFFTSSALLFAPVIIEVERSQMEEMQRQQQRQVFVDCIVEVEASNVKQIPYTDNNSNDYLLALIVFKVSQ